MLADWQPLTWDLLVRFHGGLIPIGVAWVVDLLRGRRRPGLEWLVVAGTGFLAWRSVRFVPLVGVPEGIDVTATGNQDPVNAIQDIIDAFLGDWYEDDGEATC